MHLSPRDLDKLLLHNAGFLAQKRLARGLRLNYPEAVALIATQILELIRDGHRVAELMDTGRRILGRAEVLDGVPEMIHEVQVEGTFPTGPSSSRCTPRSRSTGRSRARALRELPPRPAAGALRLGRERGAHDARRALHPARARSRSTRAGASSRSP
jgi:urease gamma subunit